MSKKQLIDMQGRIKAASYALGGEDLYRVFNRFDHDRSGQLSLDNFSRTVRRLPGAPMSMGDAHSLFGYLDKDRSGLIDIDEFVRFVESDEYGAARGVDVALPPWAIQCVAQCEPGAVDRLFDEYCDNARNDALTLAGFTGLLEATGLLDAPGQVYVAVTSSNVQLLYVQCVGGVRSGRPVDDMYFEQFILALVLIAQRMFACEDVGLNPEQALERLLSDFVLPLAAILHEPEDEQVEYTERDECEAKLAEPQADRLLRAMIAAAPKPTELLEEDLSAWLQQAGVVPQLVSESVLTRQIEELSGSVRSTSELGQLLVGMALEAAVGESGSAPMLLVAWLQALDEREPQARNGFKNSDVVQLKSVLSRVHRFVEDRGMAQPLKRCFESYCRHGCSAQGPAQLGLLPQGFYKFICDCKLLGRSESTDTSELGGGYLGYEHVDIIFLSCLGREQSQLRRAGRMTYNQFIAALCQAVYRRSGLGAQASDNHFFGATAGALCTHVFPLCQRSGHCTTVEDVHQTLALMSQVPAVAALLESERPLLALLYAHYCEAGASVTIAAEEHQVSNQNQAMHHW